MITAAANVAKIVRAIMTSSKVNPLAVMVRFRLRRYLPFNPRVSRAVTDHAQPRLLHRLEVQDKCTEFVAAEHQQLRHGTVEVQLLTFLFEVQVQALGQPVHGTGGLPALVFKARDAIFITLYAHTVFTPFDHGLLAQLLDQLQQLAGLLTCHAASTMPIRAITTISSSKVNPRLRLGIRSASPVADIRRVAVATGYAIGAQ